MLTTIDNPFNPFEEFERWWKEDLRLGYDTCGLLARISNVSDIVSDEVYEKDVDDAMDEIVRSFPLIFRKVYPRDFSKAS